MTSPPPPIPPQSQTPQHTLVGDAMDFGSSQFMKGFFTGQLVLIVLASVIIKFLFLRGPFDLHRSISKVRQRLRPKVTQTVKLSDAPLDEFKISSLSPAQEKEMLKLVGYDPATTPAETCGWLNVFIAQLISYYRASTSIQGAFLDKLDKRLNEKIQQQDSFLDHVRIHQISLGSSFPLIKHAKVDYSENGRLRLDLDFELTDSLSIDFESQLLLHWPVKLFVGLPFQLGLSLMKIEGTLSIEVCGISLDPEGNKLQVLATFLNHLDMEFQVRSLIGHKTKVKDLPKVGEMISAALKGVIEDEMVWPNSKLMSIPMM